MLVDIERPAEIWEGTYFSQSRWGETGIKKIRRNSANYGFACLPKTSLIVTIGFQYLLQFSKQIFTIVMLNDDVL